MLPISLLSQWHQVSGPLFDTLCDDPARTAMTSVHIELMMLMS